MNAVNREYLKRLLVHFIKPSGAKPLAMGAGSLTEVNVFPLKDAVLFPGTMVPLHIFEDRYKVMTEDSVSRQIPIAMSPVHRPEDLAVGGVCGGGKVIVLKEYPDKRRNILVEGDTRFRIREVLQATPFYKVRAERVDDVPFADDGAEADAREALVKDVRRWIFTHPSLDDRWMQYLHIFDKPHALADFIAGHFLPTVAGKQRLLEESSRSRRVAMIREFLEGEIANFVKLGPGPEASAPVPREMMH